jgi:hypothetical protein
MPHALRRRLLCRACRSEFKAIVEDLLALQLTSDTLPGMMLEAAAVMALKCHIPQIQVQLMQAWITDLAQAGYTHAA